MGNKYTVEAGQGNSIKTYYGTEWLIVALVKLWLLKIDNKDVFWKRITVR
jgi:hypothetical protein